MCGIAGGISFYGEYFPSKDQAASILSILRHRGPDDSGTMFLETDKAKVSFFHTRLSIIDLSRGGHQPMTSATGNSSIVYNGEIYNYKALRLELEGAGLSFMTKSDTEVILNAFEHWGMKAALEKLDGMFAFALFDQRENALFIARDRFGKKPLYYMLNSRGLMFSSDIRNFRDVGQVNLSIDLESLGYFFGELSTPHESTIWKQVKKVKPAAYVRYDEKGIIDYECYWNLNYASVSDLDYGGVVDQTEYLLSQSVKKRLVADVRVSALLSGGIDSSLVVAKMAELLSVPVKTYTVGFNQTNFNERSFAKVVAERFGTDHTELVVEPANLEVINEIIYEFGEPFADVSMIPTYLICQEISKTEKVVVGGDGGDEMFAGYQTYYHAHRYDSVKSLGWLWPAVNKLRNIFPGYRTKLLAQLLLQTKYPQYTLLNRNFSLNNEELKQLFDSKTFYNAVDQEHQYIWEHYAAGSDSDLINVLSASLKTRLLNDYLVKLDRASMFASLEMRSPFLDKDLAAMASTLRPAQLFHGGRPKAILKSIAAKYFTKEFINREKMGFGVPLGDWFRHKFADELKRVVLHERQHLVDLNYSYIQLLVDQHLRGMQNHTNKLWSLYVFHIWARRNG